MVGPESGVLTIGISSAPDVDTKSHVSSVVKSTGSHVPIDGLISGFVVSDDKSLALQDSLVDLVGDNQISVCGESDGLGLWVVDKPLSNIASGSSDSKSILVRSDVLVVVKNSVSAHF